jgi:hypothetical protein
MNGAVHTKIRCRKCMPCRITKREEWTSRIMLESMSHNQAIFVTLTYADENLPGIEQWPGGTLSKKDLRYFFKRLRSAMNYEDDKNSSIQATFRRKIRYFACGEYGERNTKRAHYHAIIFGISVDDEELVKNAWNFGHARIDELTPERARYTARYTTKKLDGSYGDDHYCGRLPEFSLQSRKPALGEEAAELIAETLIANDERRYILDNCIRMGGRRYTLDNFMRKRIDHYMRELGSDGLLTTKQATLTVDEHLAERDRSDAQAKQKARTKYTTERYEP